MKRTETVETIHGSVEYETVDCHMCGETTREDDAVAVATNIRMKSRFMGRMEVSNGYRKNLCPFCAESVFGATPSNGAIATSPWQVIVERAKEMDDPGFAIIIGSLCAFMAAVLGVVAGEVVFRVLVWVVGLLPL